MNEPTPLACNLSEAAAYLHISRPTMLKLARCEGFPGFKIGNRWIIKIKGLQFWLDQQCGLLLNAEDVSARNAS